MHRNALAVSLSENQLASKDSALVNNKIRYLDYFRLSFEEFRAQAGELVSITFSVREFLIFQLKRLLRPCPSASEKQQQCRRNERRCSDYSEEWRLGQFGP